MGTATLEKPGLQVEETIFQTFKSSIRGQIILKGDLTYEEERKVYNGMIDKKPALIVKCRDVADVIACVNFGRDNKILTAIRSGGHNAGGLGLCDDGLVIDMSFMKGIRIDQKSNTVRAEGGVLLGDLDHATQAFGKAVPSGILSTRSEEHTSELQSRRDLVCRLLLEKKKKKKQKVINVRKYK